MADFIKGTWRGIVDRRPLSWLGADAAETVSFFAHELDDTRTELFRLIREHLLSPVTERLLKKKIDILADALGTIQACNSARR